MRSILRTIPIIVILIGVISVVGLSVGPTVSVSAFADRYQAGDWFADGVCSGYADYGVGTIYLDVDITVSALILGFWFYDYDGCNASGAGAVSCNAYAGIQSQNPISSIVTQCTARATDNEGSSTATDSDTD